jgi:3-hydroxy acid dehydrogenase / malonic semialdehyde reductase
VTGASSGIGKATAIEFARAASPDPIKIIISARRLNVLEELKKAIEEKYNNATVYPIKLDVSNAVEIKNFVKNLPKEVQEIDVLVNNAYLPY